MVRIIPQRLRPSASKSNINTTDNSRSASPARPTKADMNTPDNRKDTGLALKVVVLRVRPLSPPQSPDAIFNAGLGLTPLVAGARPSCEGPIRNIRPRMPPPLYPHLYNQTTCVRALSQS